MNALKITFASILIGIALMTPCAAEEASIPAIIGKGFETYQRDGGLAAVNVWLSGSARESNDAVQDQAVARFGRMQAVFGRMLGYEPVRTVVLTLSTRRVYLVAKFEKGVAWMSFDCYRPDKEWIISRFELDTNANQVLPPNLLGGQ